MYATYFRIPHCILCQFGYADFPCLGSCQQVAKARVVTIPDSPNAGRAFWSCSSGSCRFFLWKEDFEAHKSNMASQSHNVAEKAIKSIPEASQSIKSPTIDDWRVSLTSGGWYDSDPISRLTQENVVVFKKLSSRLKRRPDISQNAKHSFDKACSSLVLWDAGYGVGSGDLNEILAASMILRKSMLESLISISKTLMNGRYIYVLRINV
jgi:hypothetical protein